MSSQGRVIWIVSASQGPLMAFESRQDADEFATTLPGLRVNSCALVKEA